MRPHKNLHIPSLSHNLQLFKTWKHHLSIIFRAKFTCSNTFMTVVHSLHKKSLSHTPHMVHGKATWHNISKQWHHQGRDTHVSIGKGAIVRAGAHLMTDVILPYFQNVLMWNLTMSTPNFPLILWNVYFYLPYDDFTVTSIYWWRCLTHWNQWLIDLSRLKHRSCR